MRLRIGFWERQLAIAVIYAIAYSLLRQVGFAHFVPLTGFKLAVLLLVPHRYWPALLVAETGLLAYGLWDCITPFGLPFYLFSAFLAPIGLMMTVLMVCRRQLPDLSLPNFRLSSLLICAMVCSAVLVADDLLSASLMHNAHAQGQKPLSELLPSYFLAVYTGMLAIAPLALAGALEWHQHRRIRGIWQANKPLLEASALTLGAVAFEVIALRATDNAMARVLGQAALFIPSAWFSIKWGWKGSAVLGFIASFGVVLLMPAKFDPSTMMAQSSLALLLTTFIVLGAQTTKLKRALETTQGNLQKARFEHRLAEAKLQRSSTELSFTNSELTRLHQHLLIQLGYQHAGLKEVAETKQALTRTTFKLREIATALAPTMGASHPNALGEDGPIAKLLKQLWIEYQPNIHGQLSRLSKPALSMLYRLACESVGYLLSKSPTTRIVLTTHTESIEDVLVVRLTVLSNGNPTSQPDPSAVSHALGTFGLSKEELSTRAQLFNGNVLVADGYVQVVLQQTTSIMTMVLD